MANLIKALDYTFKSEGGYANVKQDRGGPTMLGITQGTLSRWRRRPVSLEEVKKLSKEEACQIYLEWYWRPLACDKIVSDEIAICMFDIGVVRGIGVPPKYAQEICNQHGANLKVDGEIGPKTLRELNAINPTLFITSFSRKALDGFEAIVARNPSQKVFEKGWRNRANRLLTLIPKGQVA